MAAKILAYLDTSLSSDCNSITGSSTRPPVCVNKSRKFLAFISGDEHNFSFLEVTPETSIYKEGYAGPKIRISRPFYNINNGGAGSAPYAMLKSPWMGSFKYFTPPPSVALITVKGKNVVLNAVRAETLEPICQEIQLR